MLWADYCHGCGGVVVMLNEILIIVRGIVNVMMLIIYNRLMHS